jgi:hypothetical protein
MNYLYVCVIMIFLQPHGQKYSNDLHSHSQLYDSYDGLD